MPHRMPMAGLKPKSRGARRTPSARLEARIPAELKRTLEQAAAVTGHPTLTSFMVDALQSSARKVIDDSRRSRLDAVESKEFVQTLLVPAAPNARLRAAYARYQQESHG